MLVQAGLGLSCPSQAQELSEALRLDALYTGEVWTVTSGGTSGDLIYIDNLDLMLSADLAKGVGWTGATAFVHGLYNNGQRISDKAGDIQALSNIEGLAQSVWLFEAWIEQEVGPYSIKLGIMDINNEFDVLDSAAMFIQSGSGFGSTFALSGENGPPTFPLSALGLRADYQLSDRVTVRAAVFDGVPGDPDRPAATVVKLGNGDGALIALEAEITVPQGKILFGHWRYTAVFDRFDGTRGGGNAGFYLRGERALVSHRAGDEQGLAGFIRMGTANGDINAYNRFIGGGLVYTGPTAGRPKDQVGLAISRVITSAAFRQQSSFDGAETDIELSYRAQITDFLAIQPDVQYILNPAADPNRSNALVLGLRAQIGVSF